MKNVTVYLISSVLTLLFLLSLNKYEWESQINELDVIILDKYELESRRHSNYDYCWWLVTRPGPSLTLLSLPNLICNPR